jgi:type 1 glutamine amidotransferase
MAAFDGKNFEFADEIYRFYPESRNHKYQPFSRGKVHVLLSVDITKHNNDKPNTEMPVAWIHRVGEGRVFYSSLGHNEYVFWDPQILKFYLAGIQYSLGDLKANDAPGGAKQQAAAR